MNRHKSVEGANLAVETSLWQSGKNWIVGVDEVGRGCLSGPVVAAAVLIPKGCMPLDNIRDSKKLSAPQRRELDQQIRQQAIAIGIGAASVAEISQLNILRATYLAMERALARIDTYDHVLIDGRPVPHLDPGRHTAIVDGDATSYAIACASIVAKVRRDRFMAQLARRHPGYGWETNAGYGTKAHLTAMGTLGLTPWHRPTFAPVQQLLLNLEADN